MITLTSVATLGASIRLERKRLEMTQDDLALVAGVGLRFIVDLEGGKPTVRLSHVLKVIDVLGLRLMLEPPQGSSHGA